MPQAGYNAKHVMVQMQLKHRAKLRVAWHFNSLARLQTIPAPGKAAQFLDASYENISHGAAMPLHDLQLLNQRGADWT